MLFFLIYQLKIVKQVRNSCISECFKLVFNFHIISVSQYLASKCGDKKL